MFRYIDPLVHLAAILVRWGWPAEFANWFVELCRANGLDYQEAYRLARLLEGIEK